MTVHSDISLFLRFEPDIPTLTHQHGIKPGHSNGKSYMYKTQELKDLEHLYVTLLKPHAPKKPWKCPIELRTTWFFRRPEKATGVFKTTKPDTDNLVKTLKDCLSKAKFWKDDALVVSDWATKLYAAENEKIGIAIEIIDMTLPNSHE